MAVMYWWIVPLWLGVISVIICIAFRHKSHAVTLSQSKTPIAHSGRITQLASYKKAYARYRLWLLAGLVLVAIALATTILLTARPVAQDLVAPQQRNRDIMLCMDVSGSMLKVDKEIFETFEELVTGFKGQRIGLTTFNSSAITVFPLTDDYELLETYMKQGTVAFEALSNSRATDMTNEQFDATQLFTNGTSAATDRGSSIIGDGLASCVNRMGENEAKRPQSIIFATDNELAGQPIYTTLEAAALASSKDIRVYAVDPGLSEDSVTGGQAEGEHAQLRQAALLTGGLYSLTTEVSVPQIISDISKQEASLYTAPLELVQRDTPTVPVIIVTLIVIALVVATWRFRL